MHQPVLTWIANGWIGSAMRHDRWLFPLAQILHFVGLCLLVGAIVLADVRLLGFLRRLPVKVALSAVPIALSGFTINAVTGFAMFSFNPFGLWVNTAFKVKMLLILIAGANALWFTRFEQRTLLAAGADAAVSLQCRLCAGLSLALWCGVIVAGRMMPIYQPF